MANENEKVDTKKYLYILLSIFVAASIWFFVDEHNNRTVEVEFKDIPITYRDVNEGLSERGLMLVEGEDSGTSETIDLTLEGRRRLITDLDSSKITVTVDLSDITETGKKWIRPNITYSERKFADITVESSYYVTVNISELNRRTVDVRCEVTGNVANGYSAGEVQLSQTEVELRGQAKDIDPVSFVKVTLDIGQDASETISRDLTFQYYDRNGNLLDGDGVRPTVEYIQARLPVFVTKELNLVVNFSEAPGARLDNTEWDIFPKSITVSGDASQLKNVNNIILGDCDLLKLTAESTSYEATFPIIIPEGCKNLSGVTRATLKIRFKDMISTELLAVNFDYANLPEGKTATILTEELPIALFGTSAVVTSLTSDDIIVIADLSDYTGASGTYSVPATVKVTSGADVGVSGTYQVQARISETPSTNDPMVQAPSEE